MHEAFSGANINMRRLMWSLHTAAHWGKAATHNPAKS
ncbi:hypothetical protein [Vibrio phage vB_VpaS_CHI]|nr:hypothetical protein [Vibrio phage vB_VpaS_ALK]USL90153.1 hypothetical protein [Vibrio phage vB_VpaS_CHI]